MVVLLNSCIKFLLYKIIIILYKITLHRYIFSLQYSMCYVDMKLLLRLHLN